MSTTIRHSVESKLKGRKRAKTVAAEDPFAESMARKLREQGEQFMRMFDDYESGEEDELHEDREGDVEVRDDGASGEDTTDKEEGEGRVDGKEGERKLPQVVEFISPPPPMRVRSSRKDWRLFMSSRAADVHQEKTAMRSETAEDEGDVREELAAMAKEVEALGASNFAEKDRRAWVAKRFMDMGAKAKKPPRTPPQIGKGMKRKAEERVEKERQEAIESGMIRVKGSRIAKERLRQQETRKKRDDGINASEGKFRNGILHVKPAVEKGKKGAKGAGMSRVAHDSGFSGATWKGGRQKSKNKGKGKKTKNKKRR